MAEDGAAMNANLRAVLGVWWNAGRPAVDWPAPGQAEELSEPDTHAEWRELNEEP